MVRVRVASLLAAVVVAPASVLPAAATTVAPFFTVIGDGPASADVTPTTPVSFEFEEAEILGTGRYGGVLVWEVWPRRRHVGSTLDVAGLGRFSPPVPAGGGIDASGVFEVTLEAGRTYRVYLLGDAHTEVRIRPTRGRGFTVRPTTPHRQAFALATLEVGPVDSSPVNRRLPLVRAPGMHHLTIGHFDTRPAVDPAVTACYVPRAVSCARGEFALRARSTSVTAGANTVIVGVDDGFVGRRVREARVEGEFAQNVIGKLGAAVLSYERP